MAAEAGIEPALSGPNPEVLPLDHSAISRKAGPGLDPAQPPCGRSRASSLHAHHLFQRVDHLYQIRLSRHHGVNRLIRPRRLVNHAGIFSTFNAFGGPGVILYRELFLSLPPRHGPASTMRA